MLLNEILDRPYPWKWHRKDNREWWGTFAKEPAPGEKIKHEDLYTVQIESIDDPSVRSQPAVWEISFSDGAGRQGVTKTGNEFKVFATIMDIVKDFLKNKKPEYVNFSGKEASRDKLYRRMIQKYASKWGYGLVKAQRITADIDPEDVATSFVLKRK